MMQILMFPKEFVKPESIQSRFVSDIFPNDVVAWLNTQNCNGTSHKKINEEINSAFMHHAIYEWIYLYCSVCAITDELCFLNPIALLKRDCVFSPNPHF